MGLKIVPQKKELKKGEAERTKNTLPLPKQGYGIMTPSSDITSPSKPNPAPEGTRYNPMTDQSIMPAQYKDGPSAKVLGPMAVHHNGPNNKATGNGKNSISSENVSKIAQNMASAGMFGAAGSAVGKMIKPKPMQSDTIRVSSKYKPGDYVEEYELERRIKKQTGDFPQLSVQDYSEVRKDDKGKNIVVKLND